MQDPAAAIATRGFDEAAAAKKREGLSKHQRTAADLSVLIPWNVPSVRVADITGQSLPRIMTWRVCELRR